jgi:hypothetical protein
MCILWWFNSAVKVSCEVLVECWNLRLLYTYLLSRTAVVFLFSPGACSIAWFCATVNFCPLSVVLSGGVVGHVMEWCSGDTFNSSLVKAVPQISNTERFGRSFSLTSHFPLSLPLSLSYAHLFSIAAGPPPTSFVQGRPLPLPLWPPRARGFTSSTRFCSLCGNHANHNTRLLLGPQTTSTGRIGNSESYNPTSNGWRAGAVENYISAAATLTSVTF